MPPGDAPWSEKTGIDEYDELMNPLKKWGWPRVGSAPTEGEGTPPARPEEKPRHRIADDMNTAGNRSGGPAGNYEPSAAQRDRIAGLRADLARAEAPPPKLGLKRGLLQLAGDVGPTLAAAISGKMGATQGADQRMEEGVKRRQQVADVEKKNQFDRATQLRQQIEQESIEQEREAMQQRGMTERTRIQEEMETGRDERLRATIQGRKDVQGERGEQAGALEEKRQMGRMALQRLKNEGAQTVARIHAAAVQAGGKVPPPVARAADDFEQSQSRIDVMQKSYDAAIADPANQQAMLNLLSNHLGMTMGLQKGTRMNQALIDEAMRSGVLTERIEAHFGPDGYMTGVVLTPRQMTQMMTLAQDRLQEDYRRMSDWEAYTGFKPQAPMTPRVPPRAGGAGGAGGGGGGATGAADRLKPPGPAHQGMKWQHRISNGKVEWRMVPNNSQ